MSVATIVITATRANAPATTIINRGPSGPAGPAGPAGADSITSATTSDGTADINFNQVGIGTTSPDSLLEIASSSVTDYLKLTSTGGGATPVKLIFEKSPTEQGIVEYNRNGDLELYNTDADGGVLIDGSASAGGDFYVSNSGNVGIGTTSPSVPLEVSGIIKTSTSLVANAAILNQVTAATANGNINIKNNNGVDLARFTHAGDFGIGTSSPAAKLHIDVTTEDNQPAFKVTKVSDINQNAMEVYHGTSSTARGIAEFTNALGSVMYLRGDGNVGIGTTSPEAKLEVADSTPILRIKGTRNASWSIGQIIASLEYFSEDSSGSSANSVRASINLVNEASVYGSTTGLAFSTKGDVSGLPSERLRINSSGQVGIGITNPSQKLDVDGAVKKAVFTVNTLPTATAGTSCYVSDSNHTHHSNVGQVVASGGSNFVPVYYDGTDWRIG